MNTTTTFSIDDVDFAKSPLVPAIVRDVSSGRILTLAYMSSEALQRSVESGETWFWSRSREELWNKGATSGNRQKIVSIATDCDADTLLVDVVPSGPACHNGSLSCFASESTAPGAPRQRIGELVELLKERRRTLPDGSYTASLFKRGSAAILKKVGEEATEVILAATTESRERLVSETADLAFHLLMLLVERGIEPAEIEEELARRSGGAD